jgi:hypothetical protein
MQHNVANNPKDCDLVRIIKPLPLIIVIDILMGNLICLNSKVSWNMLLEANNIFMKVFNPYQPISNMPYAILLVTSHFFYPCDSLLCYGLCFLNRNWNYVDTNLGIIYNMLLTLKHGLPPTRLHKWCYQPQHFTWNNWNQNNCHGWDFIFFHFLHIKKLEHLTHVLQTHHQRTWNHDTPKNICCLKKPNCFMAILPIIYILWLNAQWEK